MAWLFGRSMRTVWKQQRAWAMFARKHGLEYTRPLWYKAPSVEGAISGRRLRIYVEEVVDPVLRVREFRTTVEVYFKEGFPTGIAIGSRAYHDMLRQIENVESMPLPEEVEFAGLVAMTRDYDIGESYIQSHLDTLKTFFGIKRAERLLMGHEEDGFLVIQCADALDDVKTLNAQVRTLFKLAESLENITADLPETPESVEVPPVEEEP